METRDSDGRRGLYRSEFEHDACGVGMVANLSGEASHDIVVKGMTILKRLMHRGATGNDPETGDGAGLLLKIPQRFFRKVLGNRDFGVAMIFGGEGEEEKIEEVVKREGCEVLAWRDVPTDPSAIGRDARAVMPRIRQLFMAVRHPATDIRQRLSDDGCRISFERRLYVIRRQIEKATTKTYICSCSSKTIVYKGLLLATQIEKFYPDLSDPDFVSPFAIVHQRYSTNTFPSWELAHPFRCIAHNGEINALKGNLTALAAREASLAFPGCSEETTSVQQQEGTAPCQLQQQDATVQQQDGDALCQLQQQDATVQQQEGDAPYQIDIKKILPLIDKGQSDSAALDNIFELLVAAGREAPHAMMMLIPQAWGAKYHVGHDVRAFYEYHSALMEPWDGPAAVAFTDGTSLGAALDRNGLRPARWTLTKDGLFVLASETGVLDIPPEDVERHGRLKPGSLVWLDLVKHRFMEDTEIKTLYARRKPYRRWVKENHIPVTGLFSDIVPSKLGNREQETGNESLGSDGRIVHGLQQRFGWSLEDVELILRPMAETGREPVGAMGNDAALACLRLNGERGTGNGERRLRLFDFFHQLFAQVTNPPIDPIREELVMSIMTYIGNQGNILAETPEHARLVKMTRPVLTDDELSRLRNIPDFPAATLSLNVGEQGTGNGERGWLKPALDALAAAALDAAKNGAKILVLSDRISHAESQRDGGRRDSPESGSCQTVSAPSASRGPLRPFGFASLKQPDAFDADAFRLCVNNRIPSLLAVVAVNKALVGAGLRPSIGIVVESGEVCEVHHFAVLLGFGATAVNPYLALATVAEIGKADPVKATSNYVQAVCKGLMKIMSKMGISTLRSYRSARIFEAIGLGPRLMEEYFGGVVSPVGGLELEDIERSLRQSTTDSRQPMSDAGCRTSLLSPGGEYHLRKSGEEHLWTPQRLVDFREAVRNDDYTRFKRYTGDIDKNSRVTLRSQLEFANVAGVANANDQLEIGNIGTGNNSTLATFAEPVDSIVKRFVGGAMSLGSLSPEAHETIALALNGLGTMSNCGEGGENPERFGTEKNSAIKQVASGRFGVTVEYLRSAKDLQIKLAQGAKPGEGGQLPGYKVDAFVARLRHAKPGTTLISPPPHHDIYSIEDLAELIYDLKCANPNARVSVKLVSEAGVGTIAAGVAKAHADVVVISGYDGGTGAAPLTSVKHAGVPWEVGLAEAHQTLVKNNLRHRVKLQVDGQLRTGRDIVIAAMLGADEFAFGTSMLVSLGCVQCRNCNLNCCPVGIATQKAELRAKFAGKPEHLQRYFRFLAEEVRETLAALGLASLAEARGRADLLQPKPGSRFDFAAILAPAREQSAAVESNRERSVAFANYDERELIPAVAAGETLLERKISNCDRAVGAALSGWLAASDGRAVPAKSGGSRALRVNFAGTAGQSFGAFLHRDVAFHLDGEANDYVGKSLSGGSISICGNVGNVIAYGATSGSVFIAGTAGERFGIRNSGATLVVEGAGDHACEYMTGGTVLVLGPVGVNFAAGMTGGVAYVFDSAGALDLNCNLDSVDLFPVEEGSDDEAAILALLAEHERLTGSATAKRIAADWPRSRARFVKISPAKTM